MASDEKVLTVAEVATDLRCSKAHIYKVLKGGVQGVSSLPAITIGRRRLVRRSALDAWKRANERVCSDAMIDPSLQNHSVDA
jgi:excisionase family DNA binding protein